MCVCLRFVTLTSGPFFRSDSSFSAWLVATRFIISAPSSATYAAAIFVNNGMLAECDALQVLGQVFRSFQRVAQRLPPPPPPPFLSLYLLYYYHHHHYGSLIKIWKRPISLSLSLSPSISFLFRFLFLSADAVKRFRQIRFL